MLNNMHFRKCITKGSLYGSFVRCYAERKAIILGIESSCDDTGCALVNSDGLVLGESLHSQHFVHLRNGGIIPPIAQDLHRQNIERVVLETMNAAGITFGEVDAIATTVKPGLPLSLLVGMKYGIHLCRKHGKPFIPIHHMEAHALTCRMHDQAVAFPFLVLLISGGHCLLAVAEDVKNFLLLGQTLDDAPGEAFDKMARRMKLRNMTEFGSLSGGQAIELAASKANNPLQYKFTIPLLQYKDCNFSMAGLKNQLLRHIDVDERKHDVAPDEAVPDAYNLCAGFQLSITRHLCHRVQRAMEFTKLKGILPDDRQTLVVSGGAACNNFIYRGLKNVCDQLDYRLVRPPRELCTDNGVMVAWNGIEKWNSKVDVICTNNLDSVNVEKSSPMGRSIIAEVARANLACKWVKLTELNEPQGIIRKNIY